MGMNKGQRSLELASAANVGGSQKEEFNSRLHAMALFFVLKQQKQKHIHSAELNNHPVVRLGMGTIKIIARLTAKAKTAFWGLLGRAKILLLIFNGRALAVSTCSFLCC